MLSSKLLLAAVIGAAVIGTALASSSFGFQAQTQNEEKLVEGHALESYITTGDVLDPEHYDTRSDLQEIDPDRYLREFHYGRFLRFLMARPCVSLL